MAGSFGLRVSVAGGTSAYLTDTSPSAIGYQARFGFDARGLLTAGKPVDIFSGRTANGAAILTIQYRRNTGGGGSVRIGALRSGGTTWTAWSGLPDGRHALEVGWQSSTAATVRLWVDGVISSSLTNLDTHASILESVRLGPSSGLTKSMSGELQFDRFVSSRGSLIGP
jgi:hypothetical protein